MDLSSYRRQAKLRNWDKLFELFLDASTDYSKKTALDYGCDVGITTKILASKFGRVVGVTESPMLLEDSKVVLAGFSNATVEYAPELLSFDAYGEQFDFLFSGYHIAYMGDVVKTLTHFSTLLKPDGILVIVEIQGLFAIHSPLGKYKPWFENFDKQVLGSIGYRSNAGEVLNEACMSIDELKVLSYLDWSDEELSFNGPALPGSPVYQAWEERWRRLWPLMSEAGVPDGLRDAFFNCLQSPEHSCDKPVKILLAKKKAKSLPLETPEKFEDDLDLRSPQYYSSSRGGEG